MNKIFLKILVIILMFSGLQVNQIKADKTGDILGGILGGGAALGALIYAIYKRDKIAQKWNDLINSFASAKQQGLEQGLNEEQSEQLDKNAQFLRKALGYNVENFEAGRQTAENTGANMIATVSAVTEIPPAELVSQSPELRTLPSEKRTGLVTKSEAYLANIKLRTEQLRSQKPTTTPSSIERPLQSITSPTLAEIERKGGMETRSGQLEGGTKTFYQGTRQYGQQVRAGEESSFLGRLSRSIFGPIQEGSPSKVSPQSTFETRPLVRPIEPRPIERGVFVK